MYPASIKNCITERRRLRSVWQNTHYPSDKAAFNKASQQLKVLIQEWKNETLQSYLSKLTHTSDTNYSLWKATKTLKRPQQQITPLKTQSGTWARSDSEKANTYAYHLHKVFEPLPSSNQQLDNKIHKYHTSPNQMSLPMKHATPQELRTEILNLKEGKCPGYDLIDATLLKQLLQSKTMRAMFNIPQYINNRYVNLDLNLRTVKEEIEIYSNNYQIRLDRHVNQLAAELRGVGSVRFSRLKRNSIPDLAIRFADRR